MKLSALTDSRAIKEFFIQHGEKVGLGVVGLLVAGLGYRAITAETYTARQPSQLLQDAQRAKEYIANSQWRPDLIEVPIEDIVTVAQNNRTVVDHSRFDEVEPFTRPTISHVTKRTMPEILRPVDLRATAGQGSLAYKGAKGNVRPKKPAEDDKKKPGRGNKPANDGEGGAAPGAAGGGMMPGGAGGAAGAGSGSLAGAVVPPAGSELKGVRYVVVTGLVPYREQLNAYKEKFELARYKRPDLDRPQYMFYKVQRTEIAPGADENDESNFNWVDLDVVGAWTKIPDKWATDADEVVNPKLVEPRLCFPLGPLVDRPWGYEVAHFPEVPIYDNKKTRQDKEQKDDQEDNGDQDGDGIPDRFQGGGSGQGSSGGTMPGGTGGGMMPGGTGGGMMPGGTGGGMMPGGAGGGMMPGGAGGEGGALGGGGMMPGGTGGGMMPGGAGGGMMPGGAGGGMMPGGAGGGMMPGGAGGGMMPGGPGGGMMPGGGMPGMPGGGMPGMPGGEFMMPVSDNAYHLCRYFDFEVKSGVRYRYRVKLILANPNYGVEERFVEDPASIVNKNIETEWSDPSPVVELGKVNGLLAGDLKPPSSSGEILANVMVRQWNEKDGSNVVKKFGITLGQLANFVEDKVEAMDLLTKSKKAIDDFEFKTDLMLASIRGGTPSPLDKDLLDPAELLLVDEKGKLYVHSQMEDLDAFKRDEQTIAALEGTTTDKPGQNGGPAMPGGGEGGLLGGGGDDFLKGGKDE